MTAATSKPTATTGSSNGKEASPPWEALSNFIDEADAKLHDLGEKAARVTDESSLTIHLGLKELEMKWEKAQTKLQEQVDKLAKYEQKARTASDTAKVKAHLAKAEVHDAALDVRERLRGIERRLHSFKVKAESETVHVLKRLGDACNDLSRRLDGDPTVAKSGSKSDTCCQGH